MKKLRSFTKTLLRSLIILFITCICVLPNTGCFTAGRFNLGSINYNNYTSNKEMQRLFSDLDCDTTSMTLNNGNIVRLAHNNGEPIYISFDENVPTDMVNASIKTLDYVFGLVQPINPYYYYEVVEYDKYVASKSNIRYSMYNEENSNVKHASAYADRTSYGSYYATNYICINDTLPNRSADYINYVLTHELLHIFGFEDVYVQGEVKNTSDYFDNTFLNVSDIYINSGMISPNDYKFLLSAYSTRECFNYYTDTINTYNKLINDYTTKFYDKVASVSLKGKMDKLVDTNLQGEIELKSQSGYNYIIKTNANDYILNITKDDQIIESISGKIANIEIGDQNKQITVLTNINSTCLATTGMFSTSSAVHTNLILYSQVNSNKQFEYRLSKLSGGQLI